MVLPLYLAMTGREILAAKSSVPRCAYMACHFSPYSQGLTNLPTSLPPSSMLILNDRMPWDGHSGDLVAHQLQDAVTQFRCESLLLDFQRPPTEETQQLVRCICETLSCPVAVTEGFTEAFDCPLLLSPAPLHIPLEEYLAPWKGREIWLEAALCQEEIRVRTSGAEIRSVFPTDGFTDGFYDEELNCHYRCKTDADSITFTLFDTLETLQQKLELAHALGVTRGVGLWQELKTCGTTTH